MKSMKTAVQLTLLLTLAALASCSRERSVPGSPVPFEPAGAENNRVEDRIQSNVRTTTTGTANLTRRWKNAGIVVARDVSPNEEALIAATLEGMRRSLPGTHIIRLPRHWENGDPAGEDLLDIILVLDVPSITWTAPEKQRQEFRAKVRIECLGYPFDNVHYGTPSTPGSVKPEVEVNFEAQVQGVIRSDTLLNKVRESFTKEMEGKAGKWFVEDVQNPSSQSDATITSATSLARTDSGLPELLADFPLPTGSRVLASGQTWDRLMDRTAYALIEMAAPPQDSSRTLFSLLDGRLVAPERYWQGSLEGWIHWTLTEPGSVHEPYAANPSDAAAVRVHLPGYVIGETQSPGDATATPLLLTARRTSSPTELADLTATALAGPVTEMDALLAYRLKAWPKYQDLTRQLFQRAADEYPEDFMVQRTFAEFLKYDINDPAAALKQYARAREALGHYTLKKPEERYQELDKMEQELQASMAAVDAPTGTLEAAP